MDFDLIVQNGVIVTATEVLQKGLEIGIKDGKIVCIGRGLPAGAGTEILDAEGAYVTPGGVDSHVHLAQTNSPTGDNFESGSRSAVAGGTTTILAFASQSRDEHSLFPALEEYRSRATGQSHCDYGFHFILTNPTPEIMRDELPLLASREGITSVKLYMTYEAKRLNDKQVLDVLFACKALGMTSMIHAESHDIISAIIDGLERNGNTAPWFHGVARPRIAEDEASYRAISLAELADAPMLLVHMSSDVALGHVRDAQTRLLPIHAEACPHYLFLLSEAMHATPHDHFAGAKHVCSPPLRHSTADLDALWTSMANGTFTVLSSDHAPSKYDHPRGKKLGLAGCDGIPRFSKIPNGLPGVETRLALMFSQTPACQPAYSGGSSVGGDGGGGGGGGCGSGSSSGARLTLPQFVALTSTNAAKLYGLDGRKGSVAPGYDADLVVWHPGATGARIIAQEHLHHAVDYTPFEGMRVGNWPRYTLLRGRVVWDAARGVVGDVSFGKFLHRGKGQVLVGQTGNVPRGMLPEERKYWT